MYNNMTKMNPGMMPQKTNFVQNVWLSLNSILFLKLDNIYMCLGERVINFCVRQK